MFFTRQSVLGFIALAVSLSATASAQTVLYRETYGIPPGGPNNQASVNWDWVRFLTAGGAVTNRGISNSGEGKPTDLANTSSAGLNADGTMEAYVDGWIYMENNERIAFTTEYSFDPAASGPTTFSWWQGANYDSVTPGLNEGRVAIRIGNSWYVSSQIFTNTAVTGGGNFGSTDPAVAQGAEPQMFTYNPAPANWLTLVFDGTYDAGTDTATDSTLGEPVVGEAPTAALSGPITAFGLYRNATGSNFRFDTFTIESGGGGGTPSANFDGINGVDGNDFLIWQRGLGATTGATKATGDANGDGAVDATDLTVWRNTFGTAGAAAAAGAVPEPSALALLLVAAAGLATRRQRA